ncbi:hypothetical protein CHINAEXTREME_15555 [Halobiforma lacisalsi AJ5]|uniref:DUF7975 domain-containing protein n=1 Tax=Natronobacterium lacisalsi AJ5 TaxID=358396 RepID=M0LDM9_NATLA|nr:hypothetical protein [Halobiforma lacisalsi]APW99104.1 hypothetical protein CHINAEXTREME_15555 [Halobiforma lacisalsi AJ5]EMA31223.1 hypothetical protein C445_14989 [Halobiforma lacisalsi AJ5]
MTRFDASDPTERRKLYVDAISAHRKRSHGFLTLEVDDDVLTDDGGDSSEEGPDPDLGAPWLQFADGTINLDCTDAELETLKSTIGGFPAFKIDEVNRPEEAAGTNVRISAKADGNRIAQFIDAVFLEVYELPETFRVWVVEI